MQVQVTEYNGMYVLECSGRLDAEGAPLLERESGASFEKNPARMVLDMTGVDYVSSAGLRIIFMIAKRAREGNGELKIAAPQPAVRDIFAIAGLNRVVSVLDTVEAALA